MQKRIRAFIEAHQMIKPGDRIVAGVSGGADSVCLFEVLRLLRQEIDFQFAVVHVNHMLRGEESESDEAFVRALCERHGILCRVYRVAVKELAQRERLTLEEAGRRARYEAFANMGSVWGGNKTALAHHQDDCAETMLYNMARGTGPAGLCSLRPVRGTLIRPLLCMDRREIEQYLEERALSYRIDSSNLELHYARNKIRHQVLPPLTEGVNSAAVRHMAALARDLEEVEKYLETVTAGLFGKYTCSCPEGLLVREGLRTETALFQKRVLAATLAETAGTEKDFSRRHLLAVCELLEKPPGKELSVPYRLRVLRTGDGLLFVREGCPVQKKEKRQPLSRSLVIPGITQVGEFEIECRILRNSAERIPEKAYTKWLDCDRIEDTLIIRTRRPGDFIVINKEGGRKKLKDYFIDSKIPREERDHILLLTQGSEVLWIIGHRLSQRVLVGPDAGHILQIEIKGGNIHE